MKPAEAESLVVVMAVAWPTGSFLTDDGTLTPRGRMYAADLEPYDVEVGAIAVENLRRSVRWSQGPSPAELNEALVAARREVNEPPLPALPSAEEFTGQAPPEARELLAAYFAKFGGEGDARAAIAKRRTSGAERVEAMRLVAAARETEERQTQETQRNLEHHSAVFKVLTACGVEAGALAIERDGEWVCPNCGSPTSEGCLPPKEAS